MSARTVNLAKLRPVKRRSNDTVPSSRLARRATDRQCLGSITLDPRSTPRQVRQAQCRLEESEISPCGAGRTTCDCCDINATTVRRTNQARRILTMWNLSCGYIAMMCFSSTALFRRFREENDCSREGTMRDCVRWNELTTESDTLLYGVCKF